MQIKGINPVLMDLAREAIEEKDALGFMCLVGHENRVGLLWDNLHLLQKRGMYEAALYEAFTTIWNCAAFPIRSPNTLWPFFFGLADRQRLRGCGDPLPHAGPFTLYRGVSGVGRARRVKGYSWTGSLDTARWFAGVMSYGPAGLPDPAVFVATIPEESVLFYTNERNENEYVVSPEGLRPRRIEQVTREQYEVLEEKRDKPG